MARQLWAQWLRRELLEYLANTLIFVLAGVIIAGRIWCAARCPVHCRSIARPKCPRLKSMRACSCGVQDALREMRSSNRSVLAARPIAVRASGGGIEVRKTGPRHDLENVELLENVGLLQPVDC